MTKVEDLLARLEHYKKENEQLNRLTKIDPLTKVRSRRAFLTRFRSGDADPEKEGLRDHAFFVQCDLDGFKTAQDTHPRGHDHGDDILCEFASFLLSIVRGARAGKSEAMVFRTGGDEFTIWVENKGGARRIRDEIREWISGLDDRVTASSGMGPDKATADANTFDFKKDRRKSRDTLQEAIEIIRSMRDVITEEQREMLREITK